MDILFRFLTNKELSISFIELEDLIKQMNILGINTLNIQSALDGSYWVTVDEQTKKTWERVLLNNKEYLNELINDI